VGLMLTGCAAAGRNQAAAQQVAEVGADAELQQGALNYSSQFSIGAVLVIVGTMAMNTAILLAALWMLARLLKQIVAQSHQREIIRIERAHPPAPPVATAATDPSASPAVPLPVTPASD